MELWNEALTEKSHQVLGGLKGKIGFVLIGGWAVYFHTGVAKSKDIDLYIDFKDFFKMQSMFAGVGVFLSQNPKLKKYEAKVGEIDIDIYTPDNCPLIVPCKDVFKNKWFRVIEGFNVILPEPLLLLKTKAEEQRAHSLAGFKDRIDILALLHKVDMDKKFLYDLVKIYDFTNFRERVRRIISNSKEEYSYFFREAANLRELRKLKSELFKRI